MSAAITFGPIVSRRLGHSLGINNIPPKHCSYDCVYCQVGRTRVPECIPRPFYSPEEVAVAVHRHLRAVRARGGGVDFLTFVPDGEPTLDSRLGETIDGLRRFELPIAVFTNASLLWLPDVRSALHRADWVSLKVDAVRPDTWQRLNGPHVSLELSAIQRGTEAFAHDFGGTLATETLLLEGINDSSADIEATAERVAALKPATAYVGIPTRPMPTPGLRCASAAAVLEAYEAFAARLPRVELLTGDPSPTLAATGDLEADLLGITAVQPLREEEVARLVADSNADPARVTRLLAAGALERVEHRGHTFYVRGRPHADPWSQPTGDMP